MYQQIWRLQALPQLSETAVITTQGFGIFPDTNQQARQIIQSDLDNRVEQKRSAIATLRLSRLTTVTLDR